MDNRDKEIIVATFHSHYGAMLLKKNLGAVCSVRSVPRSLSSSCGTCAFVENTSTDIIIASADSELLEAVYLKEGETYTKVFSN